MSAKFFVDTTILMYAHDASAGVKHDRARAVVEELWRDRTGVLSTQVLQELAVNLRQKVKRPLSTQATREIVSDYLSWEIVPNTGESILDALELQERYKISFWDALILCSANTAGVEVLYSEDLSNNEIYSGVRVVNPLT